jgi:hypothetical protein
MRTLEDRVEYGQSIIEQAVDQSDDRTQAVDLLSDLGTGRRPKASTSTSS